MVRFNLNEKGNLLFDRKFLYLLDSFIIKHQEDLNNKP